MIRARELRTAARANDDLRLSPYSRSFSVAQIQSHAVATLCLQLPRLVRESTVLALPGGSPLDLGHDCRLIHFVSTGPFRRNAIHDHGASLPVARVARLHRHHHVATRAGAHRLTLRVQHQMPIHERDRKVHLARRICDRGNAPTFGQQRDDRCLIDAEAEGGACLGAPFDVVLCFDIGGPGEDGEGQKEQVLNCALQGCHSEILGCNCVVIGHREPQWQ